MTTPKARNQFSCMSLNIDKTYLLGFSVEQPSLHIPVTQLSQIEVHRSPRTLLLSLKVPSLVPQRGPHRKDALFRSQSSYPSLSPVKEPFLQVPLQSPNRNIPFPEPTFPVFHVSGKRTSPLDSPVGPKRIEMSVSTAFLCVFLMTPSQGALTPGSPRRAPKVRHSVTRDIVYSQSQFAARERKKERCLLYTSLGAPNRSPDKQIPPFSQSPWLRAPFQVSPMAPL